ncbi:MAG TPA: AI-2E family transporter, partial [Chloroflexota bacterium]|nr:AI-2E family transporter [Chloroflexota bacterium]
MRQKIWLAIPPLAVTVVIAFGVLFLAWFVSQTLWVWVVVLIALILASAMTPLVNLIQRPSLPPSGWHIPRGLAVFLVYLFLSVLLGVGGIIVGNLLIDEITGLLNRATIPALTSDLSVPQQVAATLHLPPALVPSSAQLADVLRQIGSALLLGITAGIPNVVTFIVRLFIVLTLGAFLVISSAPALNFWVSLFPVRRQAQVRDVTTRMGRTMGWWLL